MIKAFSHMCSNFMKHCGINEGDYSRSIVMYFV